MATRKKAVPTAPAVVAVETAPAVIMAPRPTRHVGRTWEVQATRVSDLVVGNPNAPTLVWSKDGLLVRCVGDKRTYLWLSRFWRLTGGYMLHARIGADCVTYARFTR